MDFDKDLIKDWNVGQVAAVYAAERSSIYSFRTGAALVKDDKVVEIGWSHVGAIKWKKTPYSTHAEAHAIHRAGLDQAKGCKLYIATISRKGNLTMACPCEICESFIHGIVECVNFTLPDSWGLTNNWYGDSYLNCIPAVREVWELQNDKG